MKSMLDYMYIFAYGSLINKHTRSNDTFICTPVRLRGYCRGWNAAIEYKKVTALGIYKDMNAWCNGILCKVTEEELVAFDTREGAAGYKRVLIPLQDLERYDGVAIEAGAEVCTYVVEHPTSPSAEYPLIQTYIDTVLYGCLEYGEAFLREFIQTTKFWDYPLVNDRNDPVYPRWTTDFISLKAAHILESELKN